MNSCNTKHNLTQSRVFTVTSVWLQAVHELYHPWFLMSLIRSMSSCLSLDILVSHLCVIVFKNRIIVSRTIKGNDAFLLGFPEGGIL